MHANSSQTVNHRGFRQKLQKQLFSDLLPNSCSENLRNIYRKTPVLEYLFKKVANLRAAFFIEHLFWLLLKL